jgi:hypothetical protein
MKIQALLAGLVVLGSLAIANPSEAAKVVTNGKDGKSVTFSETGEINQATVTYSQTTKQITWTGKVLLRSSCEYLDKSKIVPINYFVKPGPTDPVYTLQVNVLKKSGKPCNEVAKIINYWGNYGPVYLTSQQMNKFENVFVLNNVYPDSPTPPVVTSGSDNVDFSKLKWNLNGPDKIVKNGVTYTIGGRLLSRDQKANCTGLRYGMAGPFCKEVIATSPNPKLPPVRLQTVDSLAKNFGPITNLPQLQFITSATRNNGFNGGQVIYNGKLLTREQRECTSTVTYYSVDSVTYNKTAIKTEESNQPAMCE